MSEALKHFALKGKEPRRTQKAVISAIEEAFKHKNTVILEAPVGSGKSAIAMTLAEWLGESHILTPRKSLQDQYYNDFKERVAIVKGKGGYPCAPRLDPLPEAETIVSGENVTFIPILTEEDTGRKDYEHVIKMINQRIPLAYTPEVGCDQGPCEGNKAKKANCTLDEGRPCPYNRALRVAQASPHIIHNIHSFFYQNKYGEGYARRKLIVIDECHDLESTVRGFLQTKVGIPIDDVNKKKMPSRDAIIEEWIEWFLGCRNLSFRKLSIDYPDKEFDEQLREHFSRLGRWLLEETRNGKTRMVSSPEKKYSENLSKALDIYSGMEPEDYIVSTVHNHEEHRLEVTFTPIALRGTPEKLFLSMGEKRLLMSGTIYDKKTYCKNIGLLPDDVEFLSIDSDFPKKSFPIFCYSDLMTDNSYASWNKDRAVFPKMIENMKKIMNVYKDKKGIIHAPSYSAMHEIAAALNSDRVITHSPNSFLFTLDEFCQDTESNDVLISPVCQQGVDFKYDIARFQMIVRVPYANTSDDFVDHMRETNFMWYNYQSLIVFGQMIGRTMRSGDDWGHTYLLDSRFGPYLARNRRILQKWLLDAVKYR